MAATRRVELTFNTLRRIVQELEHLDEILNIKIFTKYSILIKTHIVGNILDLFLFTALFGKLVALQE